MYMPYENLSLYTYISIFVYVWYVIIHICAATLQVVLFKSYIKAWLIASVAIHSATVWRHMYIYISLFLLHIFIYAYLFRLYEYRYFLHIHVFTFFIYPSKNPSWNMKRCWTDCFGHSETEQFQTQDCTTCVWNLTQGRAVVETVLTSLVGCQVAKVNPESLVFEGCIALYDYIYIFLLCAHVYTWVNMYRYMCVGWQKIMLVIPNGQNSGTNRTNRMT